MKDAAMFLGRPVFSLQTMLREIAQQDSRVLSPLPTGTFDHDTKRSVLSFQRASGLPQTGIADLQTWNAVVAAHNWAVPFITPPEILPVWNTGQTVTPGESSAHLYLAQAMLTALSHHLWEIRTPAVSGILDPVTAEGLRSVQRITHLPQSGNLDSPTWQALNDVYRTVLGDGTQPICKG